MPYHPQYPDLPTDKQDSQSMQTDSLDSASEFPYLIALLIVLKFFHHAQALSRRSADVIQVASDLVNLPKPNGTPKNVDIVAKVYWSEDTPRPAEDNLLEFAHAVLHGHHSYRCTLISPSFVRNKPCSIAELPSHFNIDDPIWRGVPSYYIPRPIHEIIQDDLFIAWTDCFKIHFELWKQGSHHRNITPDNLMYVRDSEGHVVGALNDFDIVAPGTSNSERSGSFAFMATDLMKHKPPTVRPQLFFFILFEGAHI
ncbi:hypothetical protein BDY19DRAFT_648790 [Irpex rosettiformis]|uniref:Uncharacterized protein n=1 Tax=Irpex rosettiformis TaxID=378272 RepID=A0ACB8TNL5_9APHY|nr:hypothetical protein BDY19DRAFT_648790 [Irpex rosettiformis]